jgi:hypothetical protein
MYYIDFESANLRVWRICSRVPREIRSRFADVPGPQLKVERTHRRSALTRRAQPRPRPFAHRYRRSIYFRNARKIPPAPTTTLTRYREYLNEMDISA